MRKLKIQIDSDIDFRLFVTVEAFGLQGVVGIRRKKVSGGALPKLQQEEVVASTLNDFSKGTFETSEDVEE